jgi:hypothetical protein
MGYYSIDPQNPPSVEEVIKKWMAGDKAYDPRDGYRHHGMYRTKDLIKYREYSSKQLRNPPGTKDYEDLKRDIEESGIREPLIIQLAKDGKAKIGEGNHRHQIALELGIEKIPVKFLFQQNVYEVNGIPAASNREPYRTSPVERHSGSSFGRDYGEDNMPYVVDGKCVYKKKSDGSRGEKVGCTDGSVKDYLAALHTNVDESKERQMIRNLPQALISKFHMAVEFPNYGEEDSPWDNPHLIGKLTRTPDYDPESEMGPDYISTGFLPRDLTIERARGPIKIKSGWYVVQSGSLMDTRPIMGPFQSEREAKKAGLAHPEVDNLRESKKMKIKPSRLKQIIQEEVSSFIAREEEPMGEPPADFAGEPDYEGDMARSQLLHLSKYSTELMNMMDDSTQLPAWVQSKITKAADYLGAVKHYIEGQTEIAEGKPKGKGEHMKKIWIAVGSTESGDKFAAAFDSAEKPTRELVDSVLDKELSWERDAWEPDEFPGWSYELKLVNLNRVTPVTEKIKVEGKIYKVNK